MNDVHAKITELREKGWTLASIAEEVGVTVNGVEKWVAESRYPANPKGVLLILDSLLKRKRIPKKRRYTKPR